MMKLCLMASHGYPPSPGFVLHQEHHDISRVIKDFHQPYVSSLRQELMRSGSISAESSRVGEMWKSTGGFSNSEQLISIDSIGRKPVLFDIQDTRLDSIFFSHGIAENYTRHEKILQFLMSDSNELDEDVMDLSVLSDMMHPQALTFEPFSPSLVYPNTESSDGRPLVDFLGEMALDSKIIYHPDGRVLFTGSKTEMKDFLSVVAEFYLSKNSNTGRRQSMVVPYIGWKRFKESSVNLEAAMVAPLKSAEKTKKPRKKKDCKKVGKESDMYKRNNLHACEDLLSLMLNKGQNRKTAVLSLKKSGPELPQLLNQFSATIAGTGLAVLFSVLCKLAFGRVAISSSRLLSTGMGVGLVWLSWAVSKLRDTVVHISKNASKLGLKEDEMMLQVDRSVKSIYLGAAGFMALVVLRLA